MSTAIVNVLVFQTVEAKANSWLRSSHAECRHAAELKHLAEQEETRKRDAAMQEARVQIGLEVARTLQSQEAVSDLKARIDAIALQVGLPANALTNVLSLSWSNVVEQLLLDGVISEEAEVRLVQFKNVFSLTESDLNVNGQYTKVAKAAVLRDIFNGKVPERFHFEIPLPVNLLKGEKLVWAFPEAKYYEEKVRREFVAGSRGASIRIVKGFYYRVGSFKGHTVEHLENVCVDQGWVVITDRNIYFAGPRKSFRLPYPKIVSFEPYSDGIGFMRDAASAKPQTLQTNDGWFTYNMVVNLAQL
jgi:hypothetical protein